MANPLIAFDNLFLRLTKRFSYWIEKRTNKNNFFLARVSAWLMFLSGFLTILAKSSFIASHIMDISGILFLVLWLRSTLSDANRSERVSRLGWDNPIKKQRGLRLTRIVMYVLMTLIPAISIALVIYKGWAVGHLFLWASIPTTLACGFMALLISFMVRDLDQK